MVKRLLGAVCVIVPIVAGAHGAGFERLPDIDTVALRFAYAVGEPMAGARVVVTTPAGQDHQRGQTDRDGQFAFVPDRPGDWMVVADDGLGHEVRAEVEVGGVAEGESSATPVAVSPRVLLYALIGSLAVNAGLLSLLLARRRA